MHAKKWILVWFFSLGSLAATQAQSLLDNLVKGVAAHQKFELMVCDSILSDVLLHRDELSASQYGEAMYFYYRNLSRMAVEEGNGTDNFAKTTIQMNFFRAYHGFLELEKASIPRWSEKSRPEIQGMFENLIKAALNCLEQYVNGGTNPNLITFTESYLNLAISILPESYVPFEVMGQLYFFRENYSQAGYYFDRAITNYRKKRVLTIDNIRMPTVYFTRASMLVNDDVEWAYRMARNGLRFNELEWKTLTLNEERLGKAAVAEAEVIYLDNQYNLGLLQAELAAQIGDADSARTLFAEYEKYYSKEPVFQYHYGRLLENVNPRESAQHYQEAIDLDPDFFEARFGIANLYINMGYYYLQVAQKDKKNAAENKERAKQMFEIGYNYMKKTLEIAPDNRKVVLALVKVSLELDYKSEHEHFKNLLDEL
ncbi:hypothetical protein GC194_02875 [bacterium]|nr:hypothetical protein [bacterium]